MDVQACGVTHNLTASAVQIPMVMDGLTLMHDGRQQPIVTVLMHSQTTQRNGAMRTTMDLAATPKETNPTSAPTTRARPPLTALDALIETVMATQKPATPSPMTAPNGRTEMATTAETTPVATTPMRSQRITASGPTVMEMVLEIIQTNARTAAGQA